MKKNHKCKFYPTEETKFHNPILTKLKAKMFYSVKFEVYSNDCFTERKWVCECGVVKWIKEKN